MSRREDKLRNQFGYIRRSLLIFSVFAIVMGCSSLDKSSKPPSSELMPPDIAQWPINNQLNHDKDFISIDLFLSRVAKEHPDQKTLWWADYRRAQLWIKKDKNVACENFARLAIDSLFPLRRIAFLRAHEVCPKENQILSRLENFNIDNFDPWLREDALDVALQKAKNSKDKKTLFELHLQKSKILTRKEEKVFHAKESLRFAKQVGNPSEVMALRQRIYNLSPSEMPSPKVKDYLNVANDFRYRRDFDTARDYYNKVIHSSSLSTGDKLQAYRGIRTSFKIQQRREDAVRSTEEMANYSKIQFRKSKKNKNDVLQYANSQLLLARTYWTENQVHRTKKTLTDLIQAVSGKIGLSEAYWMLGRIEEEQQKFSESLPWFEKALAEEIETTSFKSKVTWYLAWNQRKLGKFEEARKNFLALKETTENTFERSKYCFWLGKTLKDLEKNSAAEDEFKDLIKEDPLSYYGLLAHREINAPLPIKNIQNKINSEIVNPTTLGRSLRPLIDQVYLEWMIAVKEDDAVRLYLDHASDRLKKTASSDTESWTQLLRIYARSQNFLALFNKLGQLDSDVRRSIIDENPGIIFPSPYFETVAQAAGRFGVSVEFIYSIMRQESSFNPQARSQMDAFGLMQLLPEVAKKSATANSIQYEEPEDLYEPHVNIPIGSAHLRELWDKYNGEIILAVASYNASESAILTWLKTRYRGDTLEFIEDVPYDETRDYVKLVLRNLVTYQILNAGTDKMNFPEWALKISYQASTENTKTQPN